MKKTICSNITKLVISILLYITSLIMICLPLFKIDFVNLTFIICWAFCAILFSIFVVFYSVKVYAYFHNENIKNEVKKDLTNNYTEVKLSTNVRLPSFIKFALKVNHVKFYAKLSNNDTNILLCVTNTGSSTPDYTQVHMLTFPEFADNFVVNSN